MADEEDHQLAPYRLEIELDRPPPARGVISDFELDYQMELCFGENYERLIGIDGVREKFHEKWNSIRTHYHEYGGAISVSFKASNRFIFLKNKLYTFFFIFLSYFKL